MKAKNQKAPKIPRISKKLKEIYAWDINYFMRFNCLKTQIYCNGKLPIELGTIRKVLDSISKIVVQPFTSLAKKR